MKYLKILITPLLWHLIPYRLDVKLSDHDWTEYGWLCFKVIFTWK